MTMIRWPVMRCFHGIPGALLGAAIALGAARAGAQEPERRYPSPPGREWMHGLVADEAGTLWTAFGGSVVEARRGAAATCTHQTGVYSAEHIFAAGGGVVVIDDDGEDIAWRIGEGHRKVELDGALGTPAGVWIDALGRPVVVSRSGGVATWGGADWARVPLPDPSLSVEAVIPGDAGELWLLAREPAPERSLAVPAPPPPLRPPHLFRFASGEITRQTLPGPIPEGFAAAEALLGWYSRASGTLWIATDRGALAPLCLRKACPIKVIETRLFGRIAVMTGAGFEDGDLVALGAQSEAALVRKGAMFTVGVPVFPEGLFLAPWESALYVASRDGLNRVSVSSTLTAGSPPPPSPLPGECASSSFPQPASRVAADPDEPWKHEAPPPDPAKESDRSSSEKGFFDERLPVPSVRLLLGPRLTISPGAPDDWGRGTDLLVGLHAAPDPDNDSAIFGFRAYAGYSYDNGVGEGHRGVLGGGLVYGFAMAELEAGARLIAGSSDGHAAYGFGESLGGSLALGLLSVELNHQVLFRDGARPTQDFGVFVGTELLLVGFGLLLAGL